MLGMMVNEAVKIPDDNPRTIIASDAVTQQHHPKIYNRKNIH